MLVKQVMTENIEALRRHGFGVAFVGAARIARMFAAVTHKTLAHDRPDAQLVAVNGQPGQVLRGADGSVLQVLSIDVEDGLIRVVRIVRNPDKLAHLDAVTPRRPGRSVLT